MPVFKEYAFSDALKIEHLYSAFQTVHDNNFYFMGEYHDFWEMVCVLSNKIGVSSDEKIFNLYEGDIIFHPPMSFHRIWSIDKEPAQVFVMSFSLKGEIEKSFRDIVVKLNDTQKEMLKSIISEFKDNLIRNMGLSDTSEIPVFKNQIVDFLENWNSSSPFSIAIKNKTELLLLDILKNSSIPKNQVYSKSADVYRSIVKVMEDGVFENLTVEEIAKRCNFSVAYIKKIFAKYSDFGIHKYYTKLRIKNAALLLSQGMSVSEVSDRLGFSNVNYFGVCFKREMGVAPSKYIKKPEN